MEISPSPSRVYFGLFLALFVAVIIFIMLWRTQKNPLDSVTNFDQCVKAGYHVTQGYPPQCTLPNGKFFLRQEIPGK